MAAPQRDGAVIPAQVHGRMVDKPIYRRALALLKEA